jgi:ABC-type polysaccharide/polyol phosphate export permease
MRFGGNRTFSILDVIGGARVNGSNAWTEQVTPDYPTALRDIIEGLVAWPIWTRLGWQEVKRRYRRTVFGPFWATFSIGVFVGAIAFVWAPLFKTELKSYLPFVATGMVAWTFTTALINEGCSVFTAADGLIKQLNFQYSILAYMVVWRNIIVFVHHLLIVFIVAIVFPVQSIFSVLLLFPGLLIVAANGAWIIILLGMVSARFRDIPPLVGNLIQVMMFITPIFWQPSQLGENSKYFVDLNYLYHLIDVVRSPLLGVAPSLQSYVITIIGAGIGWIITIAIYARFRRRIAYWL